MSAARHMVGIKAAGPIMVGYLPVAVAFGVAGVAAGFAPWQVVLMSCVIFAGASQFVLLAAFSAGTPLLWVVGLCALLNARHLLYGPLLTGWMPDSLRTRMTFAFALTDEVFATALSRLSAVAPERRGAWLHGLGIGAWFSWVAGTVFGASTGGALEKASPLLAEAMQFSLPALFLALAWQCASPRLKWPLSASALVAAALALGGHGSLAIVVGGLAGTLLCWSMAFRSEK